MTTFSKPTNGQDHAIASRRKIMPPIPYERPEKAELRKGEYQSYKLRNEPSDPNSPTYEMSVPYFSTGTPEEYLLFYKNVRRVIEDQNATSGPQKFLIGRRLLQGEALTTFENQLALLSNHQTADTFDECMSAVRDQIFPARAVLIQKRYMRRFLRKPADVNTREWVARINEINAYLPLFPPIRGVILAPPVTTTATAPAPAASTRSRTATNTTTDAPAPAPPVVVRPPAPTPLPPDEILDLIEFGIPNSWQKAMILQDFDPLQKSVKEFVSFCERMEQIEVREGKDPSTKNSKAKKNNKSPDKNFKKRTRESSHEGSKGDCMLHGPGTHPTEECRTLKAQAKRMKATYESQSPDKKKEYKKKQEMHSMIAEAVEEALKGKKKTRGKKRNREELQAFSSLNISDSEESSASSTKTHESDSD